MGPREPQKIKRGLILLTLNEIEGLRRLWNRIPFSEADEVLAVDGGSRDGTVEFLREQNVPVVLQDKPGRGEAFRTGVGASRAEFLLFFSPDGNEDPQDIPKLYACLERGCDMAVASRFLPQSRNEEDEKLLRLRAWANRAFTRIANLFFNRCGSYVTDTINGYRAIRRRAFLKIRPSACDFSIEYQMTIRAMKLGLPLAEIPTREGNRIGGASKAPSFSTGLRFLRTLLHEIYKGRNF